MFVLVENFTFLIASTPVNVKIFFDNELGEIKTEGGSPKWRANITFNPRKNPIITPYCKNGDLYELFPVEIYPYAQLKITQNSSACVVPPPPPSPEVCDLFIPDVLVTGESSFNGKNGTAVISTSSSAVGNKSYSIDGINYNLVNVFTGLSPGDYTAYAQDSRGCKATKAFTITEFAPKMGCMDPTAINYDPTAQQDNGTCQYPSTDPELSDKDIFNMYERTDEFRLVIGSLFFEIREPVGWDKVVLALKRDPDTHGVDFEFSDGSIQLSFTEVCGKSIIDSELKKSGTDSKIKLQFGYIKGAVFLVDYEGDLYFNTPFKRTFKSIDCTVKRVNLNDNIETRYETPVTLTEEKTIDGTVMPAMDGIVLPLHSKSIIERFLLNVPVAGAADHQLASYPRDSGFDHNYYITPNFSAATTNEIQSPGTNGFGVYKEYPVGPADKFDWKLLSNGSFSFDIKINTRFHFYLTPSTFGRSGRIRTWDYEWKMFVNRSGNLTSYNIGQKINGETNDRELDFFWSGSLKIDIQLQEGDKVYIFGRFGWDGDRNWKIENPEITMNSTYINIEGKTETKPSNTNAYMVHEALDRIIKSISDNKGYLKSDLLGRPDLGYSGMGPGAQTAISNGYQIRQFEIEKRPVIMSMKDLTESLNAQMCIGTSYEIDNKGNYYYRLERFDYFYKNIEIITIDHPSDYYEEADLNSIFNEIEIGYNKYPEDDVTTLDEFNTKIQVITPIISYKKKLSQLCKLIFSGYATELTRRKKFADTPVDSWKYDEDNFGFCVRQNGSAWVPEKDEAFDIVENVISPETSYNLRRTPKRMLLAWAKLLNTGFVFKKGSELIKNTFYSKNGDLTTKFNSAEPFPIGDPDKLVTKEKADVFLSEFDRFDRIFAPETINFKASLNINEINDIKRCHQNRDNTGRNYGYIRVKDNDGFYQLGYLTKMEYNPVSEMTTFILRKKYANLSNQFNCTDYADWTFSQFEAATGLSPEIEQCKFNDFN